MTQGATHGRHQPGLDINTDRGLHAKIPLVAFLAGVHLGIACPVFVLGRCRRCNLGGIDCGTGFEQKAALGQKLFDGAHNLLFQLVLFQPVAEAQKGRFI